MNTPPGQLSPRMHPGAVLMSPNGSYLNGTNNASTANGSNLSNKNNTGVNMQGHYLPRSTLDDLIENTDHPLSPTTSNPSAQHMNGSYLDSFASPSQAPLDSDLISYQSQYHKKTSDPLSSTTNLSNNFIDANYGSSKSSTVVNFTQDVNQLIYWMEKLSVQQQNTVMDNLLSSLNEEVLQYTKLKLDSLIHTGYISPSPIGSPAMLAHNLNTSNNNNNNNNMINGFDLNNSGGTSNVLGSFMPLETTMSAPAMGPAVSMGTSPSLSMHTQPQMNSLDFIMGVNEQPAAYGSNVAPDYNNQQWGSTNPMVPSLSNGDQPNSSIYDFLTGNRPRSADPYKDKPQQFLNENNSGNNNNGVDAAGTAFHNSSSKYPNGNESFGNGASSSKNGGNSFMGKKLGIKNFLSGMKSGSSSSSSGPQQSSSDSSSSHTATVPSSASSANAGNQNQAMQPSNLTDVELLQNIPMWLKSLRLHKYTENLQQYNWEELTAMSDADLQKNGIAALGARNKLLKAFKIVLDCKEQGLIAKEAYEH